jgi:SAM-dependent methyltransferase
MNTSRSFGNVHWHIRLLTRWNRTLPLRTAFARAVRPGSRVLDLGCGTGLLSFFAIQAGASTVVAVEKEAPDLARSLARENGWDHSIDFVQADVRELDLPGRAHGFDVIVAMIYNNNPILDERVSPLVFAARDKFLAPEGKLIPDRVRYSAYACDWPSQDIHTRQLDLERTIRDLERQYQMKLQSMLELARRTPDFKYLPDKWESNVGRRPAIPTGRVNRLDARLLSGEMPFVEIDYRGAFGGFPPSLELRMTAAGTFNSVIWVQELLYEDVLIFSNESYSWLEIPRTVKPGDRCLVSIDDQWRETNVLSFCNYGRREDRDGE